LSDTALVCALSSAFVVQTQPAQQQRSAARAVGPLFYSELAAEVDQFGNNVKVKELLETAERRQLLTAVAQSGLLSKAQKAGISLSKLEPLLELVADNPDVLVLVEASGPELLPLLPTLVDLAPAALPLLAAAVSVPPPALAGAGVAALVAAAGAVATIPDNSVGSVALQTLIVGLSLPLAGASFVGSALLGKLTSGK
jgi:hypothetical protein